MTHLLETHLKEAYHLSLYVILPEKTIALYVYAHIHSICDFQII